MKTFLITKMKAKVLLFFYCTILVLPVDGLADSGKEVFTSNISNSMNHTSSIEKETRLNTTMTVKASVSDGPVEYDLYYRYTNDDIPLPGEWTSTEQFAEQMMEQALMLCQKSQEFRHSGELDQAIELLDQAYWLILGINTYEDENLIREKEDIRFMISKRIIEIYASREININGSQNEIPVDINKQVQYEIDLYTKGKLRNHFIASYRRSGKYRPMIVEMLKKENLPEELSWLPLIESGFRVKALSKARALGLWQFIPSTGYKFGLNRNRYIDERLDPEKSTRAAIRYLKELHNHFGDWSTVLAAYNCGEFRVLKVIRSQKINYLDNFWDLYARLPQETARYVPKFLATLHIVENLEKYGFDKIKIDSPINSEVITVAKKMPLKDVADITGIDRRIMEELNPELRHNIIPAGKYAVKIPQGSRQEVMANLDQILRLNPAGVKYLKHRVRSGDTLLKLARRYHVSVRHIVMANKIEHANHIVSGATLKIPQRNKVVGQDDNMNLNSKRKKG
jgi:membrane-bound lytic murein transglycosylase D